MAQNDDPELPRRADHLATPEAPSELLHVGLLQRSMRVSSLATGSLATGSLAYLICPWWLPRKLELHSKPVVGSFAAGLEDQ
jgi:hypothetical protein